MLPSVFDPRRRSRSKVRETLQPGLTNRLTKYLRTTQQLVEAVRNILGLRQTYNIALVGAGNLGSAIAASTILPKRGFVIHDVFDDDPEKIGRTVGNVVVKHIDELKKSVT